MKSRRKYIGTLFTLLLITLFLLSACKRTTPPSPNAIGGTVGNTTYTMLAWDEGLRILLWGDIVDAAGTAGTEESFGLVVAATSIVVMAVGGYLVFRNLPGSVNRVPTRFRRAAGAD